MNFKAAAAAAAAAAKHESTEEFLEHKRKVVDIFDLFFFNSLALHILISLIRLILLNEV